MARRGRRASFASWLLGFGLLFFAVMAVALVLDGLGGLLVAGLACWTFASLATVALALAARQAFRGRR